MTQTKIEEIAMIMAKSQASTQKLISACQLRAAQNLEAQCDADRQKSVNEMEASKIIAERSVQQSANFIRPCTLHRPLLIQDDDQWIATYGDLTSYGPTPETAYQEFDRLWVGKDEL